MEGEGAQFEQEVALARGGAGGDGFGGGGEGMGDDVAAEVDHLGGLVDAGAGAGPYVYVVSAVDADGNESSFSDEVSTP